ncbi:hypothetical protein [Hyphomonas sp.]|uniref:alpha/beta hydrolase n=1 Tax=Hyphomonas sp. TaxID=87 RepID=UPI000C5DF79D|nr:hypothetical protein [Hyphomonas sp.]MAU68671.1 hypothetical protein [Hyphomonas sp.]
MSFDVTGIKMFGLPGVAMALLFAAGGSRGAETPAASPAPETPATLSDVGAGGRDFSVTSADGTQITGQVDVPMSADGREPVIVLSAGTGLFDRDVNFGNSGTERDAVFADLARRFTQAGIAVVRYDRRGVRYKPADGQVLDKAVSGTSTVESQRDDLGAVYDLARAEFGGPAACIALLGHSEGLLHIAGLAAANAAAPDLVVGIGGPLQAPADVFRWQSTERNAFSLRMMDADRDGTVTEAEIRTNWQETPSSLVGTVGALLHPEGQWTPEALDQQVVTLTGFYEAGKTQALAIDPEAPFPNTETPMAEYSWWQNWYTDDTPVAEKLSAWDVPFLLYYGTKDSQVRYEYQQPAAAAALGGQVEIHILPGLGHSLGSHALYGPMDEAAADALVARTAAILNERCAH